MNASTQPVSFGEYLSPLPSTLFEKYAERLVDPATGGDVRIENEAVCEPGWTANQRH